MEAFYRGTYVPASRVFDDPQVLRSNGLREDSQPDLSAIEYLYENVPREVDSSGWRYIPDALWYVEAVRGFCERWGLDRLYGEDTAVAATAKSKAAGRAAAFDVAEPIGAAVVHQWCRTEARWGSQVGEGNGFFVLRQGGTGFVPQIGEERRHSLGMHGNTEYIAVDRSGAAPLQVEGFTSAWHPTHESKKRARMRILKRMQEHVDRELNRIEGARRRLVTSSPTRSRGSSATLLGHSSMWRSTSPILISRLFTSNSPTVLTPQYIDKQVNRVAPLIGVRLSR